MTVVALGVRRRVRRHQAVCDRAVDEHVERLRRALLGLVQIGAPRYGLRAAKQRSQ